MGKTTRPTTRGAKRGGDLPSLLARLEKWLHHHRPGMLQALRPGATPQELHAFQARLTIPVPASLRALLAWHNGQAAESLEGFEHDWRLLSIAQIEQAHRELTTAPSGPKAGGPWHPAWLPVFDNNNGDYLGVDTSAASAPVRAYWVGQPDHPVVAPSLESWFQDFVTAVEHNQYHEDPERGTFFKKTGE